MRLCVIGKYPPIEGGVSAHTYWLAQALAARGHQVHVITNANEVEERFRMAMGAEDWRRCEGEYPGGGRVRVHWTDAEAERQRHIPWANAFATKLASAAAAAVREHELELIFSYYLEPYGVAGHLAAEMTGKPHVVKPAGSDFGRLRRLAQFGPLYEHVLRSAARVLLRGAGVEELAGCRIAAVDDYPLPEQLFRPDGPALAIGAPWPCLGIYGKISEPKGSFDLLRALAALRARGREIHLLAMAHGWGALEERFDREAVELGLADRVTRLPFLPHWRVPEFLRACRAVCFLERDFPIAGHTPTVPREVFACGRCLVASAEILRRQPLAERLAHGYNCIAVEDVRSIEELSAALELALEPGAAEAIGARGRRYAELRERAGRFPGDYEALFAEVLEGKAAPAAGEPFPWCRLAGEKLGLQEDGRGEGFALSVCERLLSEPADRLLLDAVRFEVHAAGLLAEQADGGLFRLRGAGAPGGLAGLRPSAAPGVVVREFAYNVAALAEAHERGAPPWGVPARPSAAAFLPGGAAFALSDEARLLLACCDGTATIAELAASAGAGAATVRQTLVEWFEAGLIALE